MGAADPRHLDLILPVLGLAAAGATLAGGGLALRLGRRIDLILGFSAGAVVGVALLDLLPEALGLAAHAPSTVLAFTALGFMAYLAVDRGFALGGARSGQGHLGAGSLTLHSVMDGLAIGLSFQVSAATAAVVTVAVLAHDISDGINTVNVSLAGSAGRVWARRWLLADAAAPLVGIGLSRLVRVPSGGLALILAVFAGFFLCIGASELIPASQERLPRPWTTIATLIGCAIIGGAVWAANFGMAK